MRVRVELSESDWSKLAELMSAGVRAMHERHGDAIEYVPTLRRLEGQMIKAVRLSDTKTPTISSLADLV